MSGPLPCGPCPNNIGSRQFIDLKNGEAAIFFDEDNSVIFAYNNLRRKWHGLGHRGIFGRGFVSASRVTEQHPDLVSNLENCEIKETDRSNHDKVAVCPAIAQTLGSISAQNVINYFNVNE